MLKCDDFKSFPITFTMSNKHTLFKCLTRDFLSISILFDFILALDNIAEGNVLLSL